MGSTCPGARVCLLIAGQAVSFPLHLLGRERLIRSLTDASLPPPPQAVPPEAGLLRPACLLLAPPPSFMALPPGSLPGVLGTTASYPFAWLPLLLPPTAFSCPRRKQGRCGKVTGDHGDHPSVPFVQGRLPRHLCPALAHTWVLLGLPSCHVLSEQLPRLVPGAEGHPLLGITVTGPPPGSVSCVPTTNVFEHESFVSG